MEIKAINNQNDWDNWLKLNCNHNPFSQSWDWGNILLSEGKNVERLAIFEGEQILSQTLVMSNKLFFGLKYAFSPHGPVVSQSIINNKELAKQVNNCWFDYFKKKGFLFWRVEPRQLFFTPCALLFKSIDINPRATLVLDLTQSEDDLLKNMMSKTRYNINLAQKKNLEINTDKNFSVFIDLMKKTAMRDGFKLHFENHYKQVFNSDLVSQISLLKNGKVAATAVFTQFGDTFTYLYGASDYEFRNLMAPHLIQWLGIKKGKELGFKWYDFFGIAPGQEVVEDNNSTQKKFVYDEKHQYGGVTRFKLGFGGKYFEEPGTFDLIIFPKKYKVYQILRKLRRLV